MDPTLCKMCCHMDMPAVANVWDGIPQCPTEAKLKATDELGCDTWDFAVSCTCEADNYLEKKGDASVGANMPAVDSDSRDLQEFCRNAVTYWVSVYHCNDVYASLSRDQPKFAQIAIDAGIMTETADGLGLPDEEINMLPTDDRPAPSLCDICGATCAFNFEGACQCPLPDGPPPDEKYAMLVFGGLIGMFLFMYFYDYCVPRPVA